MKILDRFKAPDNKQLAAIANVMLYVAGPIGTFAILIIRMKRIISADDATELTAAWATLIGTFKLLTKFTKPKENEQPEA